MAPAKGRARAEGRGSTPWLVAGGAAAMQRKQQMSKGCRVSEGRRDGYRSSPKSMEWRWVRLLGGDGRRLVSSNNAPLQPGACPTQTTQTTKPRNRQTAKSPNAHGCRACHGQMACRRTLVGKCPLLSSIPLRDSEVLDELGQSPPLG
jgi:hypothetical protein